MATKKLTIKGETVDYAIRTGLERLGLPRDQTYIQILQKDSQSIFGHKEAIIAILYEQEESEDALKARWDNEFKSKFQFRYANGEAQVHVPACFYDLRYLRDKPSRFEYLLEYLKELGVEEPDSEQIDYIAEDYQCQYDFFPVKSLETIRINEYDAHLSLIISNDKMRAQALIFQGSGVQEEEVLQILGQQGIVKGVIIQNLRTALQRNYCDYFDIARGMAPIHDQPGPVEKFFQEDERKEFAAMMEALTINTRQVKDINIAERNQLLIRIGEVIHGKDGFNITGAVLPKEDITDADGGINLGPNVHRSEDGSEIFAKESGHILWRADELLIDVEPIYIVEGNVDYNEGNIIDFVGKVLIRGDIKPRFTVSAEGDVEIHGTVEDATVINHKGNVMVAGSVINKMSGSITAARDAHCGIATNAKIQAQRIIIEKEVMNSTLSAEKEIEVTGAPGVILGGVTQAKDLVRANTIGSESWVPTRVHVGDVTDKKKRLRTLRQKSSSLRDKLKEAMEVIRILEPREQEGNLNAMQQQQLAKAQEELREYQEAAAYAEEEENQLKEEICSRRSARFEILKELYPQVDVFIYESHMVPTTVEKFSGFRCKDGRIQRYSL